MLRKKQRFGLLLATWETENMKIEMPWTQSINPQPVEKIKENFYKQKIVIKAENQTHTIILYFQEEDIAIPSIKITSVKPKKSK